METTSINFVSFSFIRLFLQLVQVGASTVPTNEEPGSPVLNRLQKRPRKLTGGAAATGDITT